MSPPYEFVERDRATLWIRVGEYAAVRASGLLEPRVAAAGEPAHAGRGGAFFVPIGGSRRGVLRAYRRGGLVAWWSRDLHVAAGRALLELMLYERLLALGIGTLRPLAARSDRVAGLFYRHWLLTEDAGGEDLVAATAHADAAQREELWRLAGAAVRALHDVGCLHADLHPRNLLVRGREVLVLDLDRGGLQRGALDERQREASLARFWRYVSRHGLRARGEVGAAEERAFFAAYGERLAERVRARVARQLLWRRSVAT